MKKTLLAFLALAGFAQATTITGSGGTTGAQFVTSTGVFLTPSNSTVQVGTYNAATNIFTAFAVADASPITFGTTASLQGRWLGNFADTSASATPFNGQAVWVRINVDLGSGVTGSGVFSTALLFPTNGGGVGDGLNLPGTALTGFDADAPNTQAGTAAFIAADGTYANGHVTVGVIPEPSVALLGALGVFGLIRRRR